MNVKKTALYIFALFITVFFSSATFAAMTVSVVVGKGTILTLKEPSKRISLSNPDIVDMNLLSPTEILLNGKKTGTTNMIVWDTKGKTTFFDIDVHLESCGDVATLEKHIKEMAPGSDITAECEGETLVLRGTTKNRNSCKRDKEPLVSRRDEKNLVDLIETQDKDTCVETVTKIEQIARFYAPKVLNLVTVPEAEQIMLEVKVAQIDKTKLKEFGVSILAKALSAEGFTNLVGAPNGSMSFSGGPGIFDMPFTTSTGTGIQGDIPGLGGFNPLDSFQLGVSHFRSGLGAVLKALSTNGLAKILAEPNLVVRSGETGGFFVGTEVPIQIVSGSGTSATPSIDYKQVGIALRFRPQMLESGVIRLPIGSCTGDDNLKSFVSNITSFITFSSGIIAPQIDRREICTSVDLREGESLILAGLLSEDMKKNIQKIPLLGDIPILGALFRSTSDELTQKELAFFITPRLVKPIPAGTKTGLPGDNKPTAEEEKEFKWIPLGK